MQTRCPTCGRPFGDVNTIPNPLYPAYQEKAQKLLEYWPGWGTNTGTPVQVDGEWAKIGLQYNVGAKMLIWMCNQRMIERLYSITGHSVRHWKNDWYRRLP